MVLSESLSEAKLGAAVLALRVRYAPPSLPASRVLDEPGAKAKACWSTCTLPPLQLHDTSVKLWPPLVDLKMVTVPIMKVLGSLGSTAMPWLNQFCPKRLRWPSHP